MTERSTTPIVLDPDNFRLPEGVQKPTAEGNQLESSKEFWNSLDNIVAIGIWESEPRRFTATRDGNDEICKIIAGSATVTRIGEAPVELVAGSILVTPDQWRGE